MNKQELNQQVAEVKSLYLLKAELQAEIEKIENNLKQILADNNLTLLTLENGTITYKEVISKTLNTTELKKSEFAFVYNQFLTQKSTMRFKVA